MIKIIKSEELKKNTIKYDLVINLTTKKYKIANLYLYENELELYKYVMRLKKYTNIAIIVDDNFDKDKLDEISYLLTFLIFYKNHLNNLIENQDKINDSLIKGNDNSIVKDVISDFTDLNKDGKYIRAILIALGEYIASDKEKLDYLNLAYAYEMFQTSILVHDDIIDNANLRRGKLTIQKRIFDKYKNKINNYDVIKLGDSIGICAGDLGFYEANKLLISSYSKNKNFTKLMDKYNDIVIKTIKGEITDVYLSCLGKYNIYDTKEQDILDIYHLKTSWYTIIGPFSLGYILGGKNVTKSLENILNNIGLAFQLKDDILGIFADSKVIGKSNVSDIEEFKQTLLYSHIINTKYKNKFLKIYGKNKVTERKLNKVRSLLRQAGTYDYATNYLDKIYKDTIKDINKLNISNEGKSILKGLLIYINIREK